MSPQAGYAPAAREGLAGRLDARAKLIGLFAILLVAVTTPPEAGYAFLGYAALVLTFAATARVPFRTLLPRVSALLAFAIVAASLVPFLHAPLGPEDVLLEAGMLRVTRSGLVLFAGTVAKAGIGALCAVVLGMTTPFPELLRGLERLKVPRVAVSLTAFTYRYLFVLADEALRMRRARDSRCYGGRWLWQAKVVGQMIGTLFVRAHDRAERVYAAMLSRGFTGRPASGPKAPLRAADYAFVAATLAAAATLRAALP